MNLKTIEKQTDKAKTLTARDWKGFGAGHQLQNGVISWKDIT